MRCGVDLSGGLAGQAWVLGQIVGSGVRSRFDVTRMGRFAAGVISFPIVGPRLSISA